MCVCVCVCVPSNQSYCSQIDGYRRDTDDHTGMWADDERGHEPIKQLEDPNYWGARDACVCVCMYVCVHCVCGV